MANCQNHMGYGRQGNMYQRYNGRCTNEYRVPEPQRECCESCRSEQKKEVCCEEPCRMEQRRGKYCKDEFAGMPVAMAYVPWQSWCDLYDVCEGFSKGTIFRELDKPFQGRGGCNR